MALWIAAAFTLARFAYYRWWAHDEKPRAPRIDVPQVEEGGAVPFVYGKTLVTRPVLAWHGKPVAFVGTGAVSGLTVYSMSMLWTLGIPFADGDSQNTLHRIWIGDRPYRAQAHVASPPDFAAAVSDLSFLDGNGGFEDANRQSASIVSAVQDADAGVYTSGAVEFLNGNPSQQLRDPTTPWAATTRAGLHMSTPTISGYAEGTPNDVAPKNVIGFRGVLSAFLYGIPPFGLDTVRFSYGLSPQMGAFRFEVSSNKSDGDYPATGRYSDIGDDANPINVIYDLLVGKYGKLGLSPSDIDMVSFAAAALTCYQEGHGFSRCFDERMSAHEMIGEVLRQIDGVIFEDPTTGTLKIKLVRADYDPARLPLIDRNNGEIVDFVMGGRSGVPNKLTVTFCNRSKDYADDSVTVPDGANAAGQDGIEHTEALDFRGCSNITLATKIAGREFAAMTQPVMRCHVIVHRSMIDLRPGDAVRVQYKNPDINGVFRVARLDHGELRNAGLGIDLISATDYVYRQLPSQASDFGLGSVDLGGSSGELG